MGVRHFLCVSLDCFIPTGPYYNLDCSSMRNRLLSLSKHQLRLCCLFGNNVWFFGEKMLDYAVGFLWKKENILVTIRYFTASGMMVNVVQQQQSPDCRFFEKNGKKLIF